MKIKKIENILSETTIQKVETHLNKLNSNLFLKNHSFWKPQILEYSRDVDIYPLKNTDLEFKLINEDLKKINLEFPIKGIMYYFWQQGSYIPWHNDGVYSHALTIYLNDDWNYNWGGLFQYYDGGDIKTIIPEKNLGVLQTGQIEHSTTITNKDTPIRKTIQIFFDIRKKSFL